MSFPSDFVSFMCMDSNLNQLGITNSKGQDGLAMITNLSSQQALLGPNDDLHHIYLHGVVIICWLGFFSFIHNWTKTCLMIISKFLAVY